MRILYVVHQFFPQWYTGTERFVLDLARQMRKMGHYVEVLTYGFDDDAGFSIHDGVMHKKYQFQNIPVTSVRHVNVPEDLSFNIFDNKFESILNTIITKENFNLVHVVHPMRLGYATKVAHSAGLPTILTLTDFWVICPGVQLLTPSGKLCYGSSDPQKCVKNCYGELWADKLTRRFKEIEELVRMVDCIVAPTQFLASLVKNVLDLHISVIPYGIDYRYIKERPEKSREQLTLGFIGTLMPHKGVHTLIDAIKLLEDNALRVKIYGDPSHHPNYYSQLTNIADNDKRIEFTGEYDYSEISRILRELDVVVVPSIWWENAPFTIQTSFAYKTPVIASNLGGMSEVVKDGVNGFLFEAGNAENLAEVIRKITTNLEVLNSIRANIISPPRIEEVAFEYEQLYRSLLSGGALDVPHPSKEMISVGEGDFKAIGEEFVQYFIELCGLKPNERILDVGSGIGRMAIPLTNYLDKNGSYEGLDIVKTEIDWCRKNISSIYPNFQFLLTDIYNKRYNIRGKYIAAEYKFPYESESFDFIFLISVFTHMLPQDMENYISEIARLLKKNGRCLITFFLLNEESLKLIKAKRSILDFKYVFDDYCTTNKNTPETAIGYDEQFIRRLYNKYGLNIEEPIRYGSWCRREKYLSYQDVILASKE